MAQVIGIIKLAPGEVGFYDEISKIHLTMSRPKTEVYDYMNTTKLIRAVRNKVLVLVAGSLNATRIMNEEAPVVKQSKLSSIPVAQPIEVKNETLTEAVQAVAEEAPTHEEVVEATEEEVVEIEQPKKRSTRKKKEE